MPGEACRLCGSLDLSQVVSANDHRQYMRCNNCFLIFVDASFHLTREQEINRYRQHNNGIDQPGYVGFLDRVVSPTQSFIKPGMVALDYGCGPTPTLCKLLEKERIACHNYDPLFDFHHTLSSYDFIFATECLEHFYHPAKELKAISELLNPHGYLGIMTERWKDLDGFSTWYYKKDPTHVCFYHQHTFQYLCRHFGFWTVYDDNSRVIILQKEKM